MSIFKGEDLIGESATGSGKTLAFGCGIIEKVNPKEKIQALVLTPTRELAEQIKDHLRKLTKELKIITVYGGVPIDKQIKDLKYAHVIVATPGRLLDHLNRETVDLSKVSVLVLDEADRMFDMGFIDDIQKILKVCPAKRQNLFFSATISSKLKDLARKNANHPFIASAVNQVDPNKLKQIYYELNKNAKLDLLVHLLKEETSKLVLVFCNTRRTVDFIVKNLQVSKINATAIHGGLSQNRRTKTLKFFNDSKKHILVCTDVASRGLHIDNVSHVYNFDIPRDAKDYVHRIGRTARAGNNGEAINLLSEQDYDNFSSVLREYRNFKIKKEKVPQIERIKIVKVDTSQNQQRSEFRQGKNIRDKRPSRDFHSGPRENRSRTRENTRKRYNN